ncbi:ATP-binding protein [Paenisporosarcina sp. NPDC076898]|uniref:ATP-binding protein n=1 Tax=unclassified Paenisporosarcina TaxID=2642018 RepID=UPI003D03400C
MEMILTQPAARPVINALRSLGYNAKTAIADLIDNSIDAKASNVNLLFSYNNGDGYIQIIDDGIGMNDLEIQVAMSIGSKDPQMSREDQELGRFGMGLKTASFSLGKRLSVLSKQDNKIVERCWDLDYVSKTNKWELYKQIPIEVKERMVELVGQSGTIIFIDKLDRFMRAGDNPILDNSFYKKVDQIEQHISFVFHSLINQGVSILINDNIVEPWDPFLSHHDYTNPLRPRVLHDGAGKVKVSCFILPHASYFNQVEYKRAGGSKGWNDQQGFYIYRENRLLTFGDWLDIFPKDQASQLGRIRIDISNKSDEIWQVDIKKSTINPPDSIKSQLKIMAKETRELSKQVFYFRTQSSSTDTNLKSNVNTWRQETNDNSTTFKLNRTHPLLDRIIKQVNDQTLKNLQMYLKLIELGSPANIIAIPHVDEDKIQPLKDIERALVLQLSDMYSDLMDNPTTEEIVNIILVTPSMEKFNRFTITRVIEEKFGGLNDER